MKKYINYQLVTRRTFLIIYDIAAVILANYLSLVLRYNMEMDAIPEYFIDSVTDHLPIAVVVTLLVFYIFRLYHSLWAYAGMEELQNIVMSCFISAGIQGVFMLSMSRRVPMSFYFFNAFLLLGFTFVSRFAYRFAREKRRKIHNKNNATSVMIVGAGDAGNAIIKEIRSSYFSTMTIKCIIDDDPKKWGQFIQGIKVVGGRDAIIENAALHGIDEIIIAIPSAPRKTVKEIVQLAGQTSCKLRTLPGAHCALSSRPQISRISTDFSHTKQAHRVTSSHTTLRMRKNPWQSVAPTAHQNQAVGSGARVKNP